MNDTNSTSPVDTTPSGRLLPARDATLQTPPTATAATPKAHMEPTYRSECRSELFVCGPEALDTVTRRRILGANNPTGRVLTCQPRPAPSARPDHTVASMLLDAVGARHGARREPNARNRFDEAVAWLAAYQTNDIIVLDAEFLDAAALSSLADLTAQARTRTWLVLETDPDETQSQFLDDWCVPTHRVDSVQQLPLHATTTLDAHHRHDVDGHPPVELPVSDPLTFMTTCQRALTDDEYAWFRTRYLQALDQIHTAFDGLTYGDLDSVAAAILNVLRTTTSSVHAVTAARACQAVCTERRIRMSLDVLTLTAADDTRKRRRTTIVGTGTHRKPTWAALAVLADMGLTTDEIVDLRNADYDPHAATVTTSGTSHPVPPEYRPNLEAARMLHVQQGHPPTHQLVAETDAPHDAAKVSRRLHQTRRETGTEHAYGRTRSARAARLMLNSYGIRLGY